MRLVYKPEDLPYLSCVPGLPQHVPWAQTSAQIGIDAWTGLAELSGVRYTLGKLPLNRSCCPINEQDLVKFENCSEASFAINYTAWYFFS